MKIGLIKETKPEEHRVGLTPAGVAMLTANGHQVFVELSAGDGSGFSDQAYCQAGAQIVDVDHAWNNDLVVKVKEPIEAEYQYLKQQIVFTYFHLAGVPKALTEALLKGGTTAIAYETLEDSAGRLPLLAPMSAIAGNMSTQMGCYYLAKCNGGKGVMLGSVLGKRHGNVLVVGDGVVGSHAARTAFGLGANVTVAGIIPENAARLHRDISPDIDFILSEPTTIAERVSNADLVVGAVLTPGARATHVITEQMIKSMQPGSVVVDVSIDQGGCIETAHATTHSNPVFEKHGVLHYCVSNMPGAYPRTATIALTDATLSYVLQLAEQGLLALSNNTGFIKGLNTHQGFITCQPVADALSMLDQYRVYPDEF